MPGSDNDNGGQNPVEEALERFTGLDDIKEGKYSTECTVQGKPAVLVLTPESHVEQDRLEAIGIRGRTVLSEVLDVKVKASLEHPVQWVDENGDPVAEAENPEEVEPVNLVDVEDEWVIKFRWQSSLVGTPPDTRLSGYPLKEGLPEA